MQSFSRTSRIPALPLTLSTNAYAWPYNECMSDGGCGNPGGGCIDALAGIIIFGGLFLWWTGRVISNEARYWPYALIVGGFGSAVAYNAKTTFKEIVGLAIVGFVILVIKLRDD